MPNPYGYLDMYIHAHVGDYYHIYTCLAKMALNFIFRQYLVAIFRLQMNKGIAIIERKNGLMKW